MSREFLDCLKRERDIFIERILSGVKLNGFQVYPRLKWTMSSLWFKEIEEITLQLISRILCLIGGVDR